MRMHTVLTWALVSTMALGLSWSGQAARPTTAGRDNAKAKVRITVTDTDSTDDVRAYQAWFDQQARDNRRNDDKSGNRSSDQLQVIVEITGNQLLVSDRSNRRGRVLVTPRTRISNQDDDRSVLRKPTTSSSRPSRLTEVFRPGDLIIAEGEQRANGLTAASIRIVGHTREYGERNTRDKYGFRAWGEVRNIDTGRGQLDIDTGGSRCTVLIERNATILNGDKEVSLSSIRRGNRVVFYSRDYDRGGTISAFRVIILGTRDAYPTGDRPYSHDPDYRDGHDASVAGPVLEGSLQSISVGVFFNKLMIRAHSGQLYTVRMAKTLQAIDRDGDRVSPLNLRMNERLRILYTDVAGHFFAERIEIQ